MMWLFLLCRLLVLMQHGQTVEASDQQVYYFWIYFMWHNVYVSNVPLRI